MEEKKEVMWKKMKLNKGIYIEDDYTKKEREIQRKLRQQQRKWRKEKVQQ